MRRLLMASDSVWSAGKNEATLEKNCERQDRINTISDRQKDIDKRKCTRRIALLSCMYDAKEKYL